MAKIFSFQNKVGTTADQDFLTAENETLSFPTAEDGAVSLGAITATSLPSPLPDLRKGWSNQELADLFRVRHLLSGAGVPVETLCDITDEGDPWFVYCHLNGDVFIHMARIDGMYVLDSPNVHRPLRGKDFNELIADFTSDVLPSYAAAGDGGETERHVIKLGRGGKVRLHPSAMLAALIWTLFLASEELILLAPKEQALADDSLLDFADIIAADLDHQIFEMETAVLNNSSLPNAENEVQEDVLHDLSEGHGQIREAMAQQGLALHQNAFAIGLSTIAIAMGYMSEAVLLDNQSKVLESLKSIGFAQYAAQTADDAELEQSASENGDALLEKLAEFLGLDLSLNTDVAEAQTSKPTPSQLQQDMLNTTEVDATDQVLPGPTKSAQTLVFQNHKEANFVEAPQEPSETSPGTIGTLNASTEKQGDWAELNMADFMSGKQQLKEFQLGQTMVKASFDITKTDAFSLSDYLFFAQRSTGHQAFDSNAQAFIDFVQAKDTDVGIVTIGNEIVMIDRGAFADRSAETYTFSWETYDGQIISMIGLKAEFQQFDLIA